MENGYAQALWNIVEKGGDHKSTVASLVEALKKHGRTQLLPRILASFKRIAEKAMKLKTAKIYVARQKDIETAMKASGIAEADVCIDESIIGGWRLEKGEILQDESYKRMLLEMYNRATS